MRQLIRGSFVLLAAMVVVVVATSASGARKMAVVKTAVGPLETAVSFPTASSTTDNTIQLERIRAAGSKYVEVRMYLSLIHISEPTRLGMISYAVFCLKK